MARSLLLFILALLLVASAFVAARPTPTVTSMTSSALTDTQPPSVEEAEKPLENLKDEDFPILRTLVRKSFLLLPLFLLFYMISEPMASEKSSSPTPYPYPSTLNVSNFVSLKLNAENFPLWKTQIMALLESQDLQGFVTGDAQPPPTHTTDEATGNGSRNPQFVAWRKTDRLIKGWFFGTLSESIMGLVVDIDTSREVWEALLNAFSPKFKDRELHLTHLLTSLRKDGDTLCDYVLKFKSICDDLSAVGKPVDDQTQAQVLWLLQRLGEGYEAFIASMLRPPIPSYQELPPSPRMTVLHQQANQRRGDYSNGGLRLRGACDNKNNKSNVCCEGSTSKSNDRKGKEPVFCQICGQQYHSPLECFELSNDAYEEEDA